MSESVLIRDRALGTGPARRTSLFAGVFLMSLSSLLLELSLTRVFSVTLFYHFAFLAISIALLGLGAGGVFAFLGRDWLSRWPEHSIGGTAALINSAAIFGVLLLVLRVSVPLQLTWHNFARLTAIYLVAAIPFFLTGLVFSVVFARETRRIGALYGADLVGGAVACMAVVPLLNLIGGPNAILIAALGMGVAGAIWSPTRFRRGIGLALIAAYVILIAANYRGQILDVVSAKGASRKGDWLLWSRWNAISRVEVDQWGGGKWITIDADASSAIMNVPPHDWRDTWASKSLMASPPAIPNLLRPRGEYAIIGPGGGVDVLRAVANGSPSVTGIEINPLIARNIMQDAYADYSEHLYQIPEVQIHVGDGRSWVRNAKKKFDVIQMTLVDTWASTSAGAFALSENNLYTVQAFKEYFSHLKPDGLLAITRWEFARPREAMRVVSVAMQALRELGVQDSRRHVLVVSNGPLNKDGVNVAVVVKRSPFTANEETAVREHIAAHPQSLATLYLPSEVRGNPFGQLITSNDPHGFARQYEYNVAPVTDDAPFFFFTLKLAQVLKHSVSKGMDWKVNLGVVVLLMLAGISALAVAAFLVIPLWLARHRGSLRTRAPLHLRPIWYFVAIGLGYILVEIALIQRFVLFLGHPTYALTVVVFLMLLSSGVGAMLSRKWLPKVAQVRVPLAVIAVGLLLYDLVLPLVLSSLVGLPLAAKLAVSFILVAPLGFLMGMPFPTGLRAMHGAGEEMVEWAWAMNAASSVFGSVLAIMIAIQFGLNVVLACGAVAYVAAGILTVLFHTQQVQYSGDQAKAA